MSRLPRRLTAKIDVGWLRTRAERTSRLQRCRSYWVWLQRRESFEFKAYALLLNWRRSLHARREAVGVAGGILRVVAASLLGAIMLAVLLELLDRLVLERASALGTLLPDGFAGRAARRFRAGPQGDVLSLLGTIAQVAGVFLGLYFAAVSGIAATVYADVPGEVRLLLTREKAGNVYIKIVAFLGAFALVLATAAVLGIHVGLANVAVVGGLAALSVFAFVILGLRTFNFFSPDALAGYLVKDIVPLVAAAQRGRLGTTHRAIPYNYQRQAEELLSTFRAVVGLSASRSSVTEKSLLRIVSSALGLLRFYESTKSNIPTASLWFKQRLDHPRWLTSDHSSVDIALRTQTAIEGRPVADKLWFERELNDVLRMTLAALLERQDRARAVEAFTNVLTWTRVLASQLAVDETLLLTRLAQQLIEEHLAGRPVEDRSAESIALADIAAALSMQVVLGMSDRLQALDAPTFAAATTRPDPRKIFSGSWPTEVGAQRDFINERLENERIVERRRITPDWYLAQLMALAMSRFFSRAVPELVAELERLPQMAEDRLGQGQVLASAAIVQRGIESCQKFTVHLGEFEECLIRLSALRRVKDIPWVETDWADARSRVGEVRTQLLLLTARVAVGVSDVETGGEIPDYFGATYTFLAEECFTSILGGGAETFTRLFLAFFNASLAANDRLKRELAAYDERTQIIFSTETIEDLLEISGYALLTSELGRGECWAGVKDVWDKYLAATDRPRFFAFLFAVLSYRGSMFGIKPRDIGRTSWQMAFRRYLGEQGFTVRRRMHPFDDEDALNVESPLVRATAGSMVGHDAGQAFIAGYILLWPEAEDLDPPRETQRFLDSVEHAKRWQAERNTSEFIAHEPDEGEPASETSATRDETAPAPSAPDGLLDHKQFEENADADP